MKDLFLQAIERLKSASAGAKGVALLVAVAMAGVLGVAGYVANKPHYVPLYPSLDEVERGKVGRALADSGIDFWVSQPPGPYTVYVDDSVQTEAHFAVFSAGALESTPGGIDTAGSIFNTSEERHQAVRKREWQETEALLEQLDFVVAARVGTSKEESSPLRKGPPVTASVALTLRPGDELSSRQARTVAKLVRFRLGVEPENLVVSDQAGNTVYDGSDLVDAERDAGDWLEQKARYERELEADANELLATVLGPDKAYVKVHTTWNTDQQSSIQESTDPDSAVVVSEETSNSKTPSGSPAGAVPGVEPNTAPGQPSGVTADSRSSGAGSGGVATDSTTRRQFATDRMVQTTVRLMPQLTRMSVSLFVDKGVIEADAEAIAKLEKTVKNAVGYDETRGDAFDAVDIAFVVPEEDPEAEDAPPQGGGMVGKLIEHGVELLAAIAFIVLFFKVLKSAKPKEEEPEETEEEVEIEIDPLELAREQVRELIQSEPERVAAILTRWAASDRATVGAGQ